jgi:NarL family two-component system response regulator LiaR
MPRFHIFVIHENPERLRQAAVLLNTSQRVIHLMSSVHECLARIGPANCDLILASATLPNDDVRKLLKRLRQQSRPAKVIVTDLPNDPKQILPYIAAGAVGYVLAQEGVGAWAKQIDAVCRGQPLVSPLMAAAMMGHLSRLSYLAAGFAPHAQRHASLTTREYEVLLLLGEGHANQVIADQLIIAVGTVKNHVHNVLTKLHLNSRKAAGIYLAYVK